MMISKKRLIWVNALVIIPLLLTACGPAATPPPPTVDVNALYTQAAVTMIAQLTANAPTLTPTLAFTDTPVPTMTPLGGALPTLPPLATLPPLSTPTTAAANTADKAAYVTQSPADYATVTTGKVFNIIWRLRNVGTTTWTPAYQYRYYAAANKIPTAANGYNLTTNVAPNNEVELTVVATAPSSPGTYDTQWVITNPDGVNFALFTLTLNVVQGSTSGTSATAAPIPGNACEDTGTIERDATFMGELSAGTYDYTVPGGEMRIYYRIVDTANPGTLTAASPLADEDWKSVNVTSRTITYMKLGTHSQSPTTLRIKIGGGDVDITKILYWKASQYCDK